MNSSPFLKVQREHSFPLLPQQIPHRLLSHRCSYPVSCELPAKMFRMKKCFVFFMKRSPNLSVLWRTQGWPKESSQSNFFHFYAVFSKKLDWRLHLWDWPPLLRDILDPTDCRLSSRFTHSRKLGVIEVTSGLDNMKLHCLPHISSLLASLKT